MSDPRSIDSTPWHARPTGDAASCFGVEPGVGHSAAEAERRLERHGPNRLAEAPKVPWWRAQVALDALRRMSVTTATVRRDGRIVRLNADELVPGDVVVVEPGDRVPADGTMAFVAFVFFQVFNLINVRHDTRSAFRRETLENRSAFAATAVVVALLVLLVEMDVVHGLFTTTDLTSGQWLTRAGVGTTILIAGELVKGVLRRRSRRPRRQTTEVPA